jgi:putative transposase
MQTVRTISCKLDPTPAQIVNIDATLGAFAGACTVAANTVALIGSTDRLDVHEACYFALRAEFSLPANLVVRAIARACMTLKVPEKINSTFAPTSIDYDVRIFKYHEQDGAFGLTLLSGRTAVKAILGAYQIDALKGYRPTAAQLVKRHDGDYYLNVQVFGTAPETVEVVDIIGVDLGIVNLAVDSDGETFSGDKVEKVRRRYNTRRARLNRVGTKSARRRLRKIRRKESRFRANENHRISKRIVAKAQCTKCAIAIEDLQGIGTRTKASGPQRNRMKGWAFHQLRLFLTYKALAVGIPIIAVDPRYTSQTCSECGHCEKANRKSRDEFCCKHCGFSCPADWNAAKNIRSLGRRQACLWQGSKISGLYTGKRLPASRLLLAGGT